MPFEEYLSSGMHIGTRMINAHMKRFVYKIRDDGLAIIDLATIEKRIKVAAAFISRANKVMVISRKPVAFKAIETFAEIIGGKAVKGRFLAGTLSNPYFKEYYEPDLIIIVDPLVDRQAVKEAVKMRIPVIALSDTQNETDNIDVIIPVNNKGKKAIAMTFYLLAKEVMLLRKKIENEKDFPYKPEQFEGVEKDEGVKVAKKEQTGKRGSNKAKNSK
mgnify:CR=1 FL=1